MAAEPRRTARVRLAALVLVAVMGSGVLAVAGSTSAAPAGQRCVVRLHGKSGSGGDPVVDGDIMNLFPNGNADGWGGRQWLYFPDDQYDGALDIVEEEVADCGPILLAGFSNGASFVAKLYCRGETFDDRLLGVVVDDPVPDGGVVDCEPPEGVRITLYWTGALEATARPGWNCSDGDWTCEGGTTIGIDAYAEWLGTDIVESPNDDHSQFWDPPELTDWSPISVTDPAATTSTPDTRS